MPVGTYVALIYTSVTIELEEFWNFNVIGMKWKKKLGAK